MRYVGYVRISSEDQVGNFSLDAQKRAIEKYVKDQGGVLVRFYVEEAKTATNDDRPAFQEMRRDARRHLFDALVVHKFDRLARNRENALAIKVCYAVISASRCSRSPNHRKTAMVPLVR